jgi:hypothetical protein
MIFRMKPRLVFLVVACALLAACQSAQKPVVAPAVSVAGAPAPTPAPEAWVRTELFFDFAPYEAEGLGLAAAEGTWRAFLDEEVTPRFAEGFAVVDAYGQRRDGQDQGGEIVRSRCRVLVIVHPDNAAKRGDIDAVREAYRSRTGARQVLAVETPVSAVRF